MPAGTLTSNGAKVATFLKAHPACAATYCGRGRQHSGISVWAARYHTQTHSCPRLLRSSQQTNTWAPNHTPHSEPTCCTGSSMAVATSTPDLSLGIHSSNALWMP